MQSQYVVTSECISAIIHRISLGLGDFEGLLYGTHQQVHSSKLKDDGTYESKKVTFIQNVFIFNSCKIISGSAQILENLQEIPKNTKVVGWISGRREVPLLPSVGDKSTFSYLSGLSEKFYEVISNELIFGLFISRSMSFEAAVDIEVGKSAMISPFEYKFFNPRENFASIKVVLENLRDTQTKYNEINFTYNLEDLRHCEEKSSLIPRMLMEECKSCIEKIEGLIPAARNQQLELEKAILENIRLKASLYLS